MGEPVEERAGQALGAEHGCPFVEGPTHGATGGEAVRGHQDRFQVAGSPTTASRPATTQVDLGISLRNLRWPSFGRTRNP